jgi:hypothetical protein
MASEKRKKDGKKNDGVNADAAVDEHYVTGAALAVMVFGLCLATFTVALDNTIIGRWHPSSTTVVANEPSNGNSTNNRVVALPTRRRLVCFCISNDYNLAATFVRQALHAVRHQVLLPGSPGSLRDRIYRLCCGKELHDFGRRKSYCRMWCSRSFLGWHDHHRLLS